MRHFLKFVWFAICVCWWYLGIGEVHRTAGGRFGISCVSEDLVSSRNQRNFATIIPTNLPKIRFTNLQKIRLFSRSRNKALTCLTFVACGIMWQISGLEPWGSNLSENGWLIENRLGIVNA